MIDPHRARLQVEPIIRDLARQKGIPMPEISDEDLEQLPDLRRQTLFRFAALKTRQFANG